MNESKLSLVVRRTSLLVAWLCVAAAPAVADVKLPHVLGSNMVLQRDVPLPVWGWADPGEAVTVKLGRHEASATADAAGKWMVNLPAMVAGGPHEMTVSGRNTIRLTDILVGEVWICSGQSNMEMGLGVVENGEQEVAAANYPNIRLYHVPRTTAGQPAPDIDATWRPCSPENISAGGWGGFSAVAYFFGRELHKQLGVPVGLINASWGGTRIEPWTPAEGFALVPKLRDIVDEIEQANRNYEKQLPALLDAIESWVAATRQALAEGQTLLPPPPEWPRHPLDSNGRPTGLYNGMVHPLVPFAIRGAIWYQGEANVVSGDGLAYHEKMKALIGGWRAVWNEGDFPFYFVQLAPFNYNLYWRDLSPDELPRLWEAQTASLSIPDTGMAVTIDIGDGRDIHPKNKQEVGRRLALWALAKTYGREGLVYSGPLYKSMSVENGKIRIRFDHVGGGLASRDGQPLNWFEVAGADRRFVKAHAEIDGDTIVVWSEDVPEPVGVRFAWHMLPEPIPNLINKEGLPASPFRTHPW
jgi:sialate O-acetylesterase